MSAPMDTDLDVTRLSHKPFARALRILRDAGLRPSRQRLGLARLLFDGGEPRHFTAEALHAEAQAAGQPVSLATIYNTLHGFTKAGLLRAVHVEAGRTLFDTNTAPHHHFYCETSGTLVDIPADQIAIAGLPDAPEGARIDGVDIVVRIKTASSN